MGVILLTHHLKCVNIRVTKCFREVFGQTANLENGYFLKEETGALRTKRDSTSHVSRHGIILFLFISVGHKVFLKF